VPTLPGYQATRLNTIGLFPADESAGYACGILAATVDGIKVAVAMALSMTAADAHGAAMAGQQTY
jgi:uncharacterized FAD-dependent dehydrogenase